MYLAFPIVSGDGAGLLLSVAPVSSHGRSSTICPYCRATTTEWIRFQLNNFLDEICLEITFQAGYASHAQAVGRFSLQPNIDRPNVTMIGFRHDKPSWCSLLSPEKALLFLTAGSWIILEPPFDMNAVFRSARRVFVPLRSLKRLVFRRLTWPTI